MKKWNNVMLLICAFLLLLICALCVIGPIGNNNGTDTNGNDTTVYNKNL